MLRDRRRCRELSRCPKRICNAQVIYWQKMNHMNMEVVLINESLGL